MSDRPLSEIPTQELVGELILRLAKDKETIADLMREKRMLENELLTTRARMLIAQTLAGNAKG